MTEADLTRGGLEPKGKKKQRKQSREQEVLVCRGLASRAGATHLMWVPKNSLVCIATQAQTHTRALNPPLLLTNERIITFADKWRCGGEAGAGGCTVHFSKQEMNSSCCGHSSPGREGRLTGCSVTLLPSKAQV